MTKKLLVSIIAIAVIAAVIGSCFALYTVDATSKVVNISADYQSYTLQINNGSTSAALSNLDLTFDPDANATKVVDVELTVDSTTYINGDHGVFKVALDTEDNLYQYITFTAQTLTAKNGSVDTTITSAVIGSGYDVALSATPVYVRLTFALTAAAIANFSAVAEKTMDVSATWEVAPAWTLDANSYYVVGTLSGANKWDVNETNQNVKLTNITDDTYYAQGTITLAAGDQLKVRKGDGSWVGGYSSSVDGKFTNSNEQIIIANTGAGTYLIKVAKAGGFYIEFVE